MNKILMIQLQARMFWVDFYISLIILMIGLICDLYSLRTMIIVFSAVTVYQCSKKIAHILLVSSIHQHTAMVTQTLSEIEEKENSEKEN